MAIVAENSFALTELDNDRGITSRYRRARLQGQIDIQEKVTQNMKE